MVGMIAFRDCESKCAALIRQYTIPSRIIIVVSQGHRVQISKTPLEYRSMPVCACEYIKSTCSCYMNGLSVQSKETTHMNQYLIPLCRAFVSRIAVF